MQHCSPNLPDNADPAGALDTVAGPINLADRTDKPTRLDHELMTWREKLQDQHRQRTADRLWRTRLAIQSPQGRLIEVDGRTLLNFCSNDYLGLANDPRLIEASVDACREFGTGSGASHLICGHSRLHQQLEEQIAGFVGAQRAVVFSTGYMANLAIPQAFLGRGDLVLQDRLNHASLIDAGRFCDATFKRYAHGDAAALREQWQKHSGTGQVMVMTDGVFSMDGDLAPLVEIERHCSQEDGLLVVDDAHGFGVLGKRGIGSLEVAGLAPKGHVLMVGTLGKAAGSFGAFVAGDAELIEHLVQFGRTYIYTTALPPQVVAATAAAIQLITNEPHRRSQLHEHVLEFRNAVRQLDTSGVVFSRLLEHDSPIQPLMIGSNEDALWASEFLNQQGLLVSAIRPPTVPLGSSRLRITLTAGHTKQDVQRLAETVCHPELVARLAGRPPEVAVGASS